MRNYEFGRIQKIIQKIDSPDDDFTRFFFLAVPTNIDLRLEFYKENMGEFIHKYRRFQYYFCYVDVPSTKTEKFWVDIYSNHLLPYVANEISYLPSPNTGVYDVKMFRFQIENKKITRVYTCFAKTMSYAELDIESVLDFQRLYESLENRYYEHQTLSLYQRTHQLILEIIYREYRNLVIRGQIIRKNDDIQKSIDISHIEESDLDLIHQLMKSLNFKHEIFPKSSYSFIPGNKYLNLKFKPKTYDIQENKISDKIIDLNFF